MSWFGALLRRQPGHVQAAIPAGTTWQNGYLYRSDLRVDPALVSGALSTARGWLELDVAGLTAEDGLDIRIEDANGNKLDHELLSYDLGDARLRVRLPTLSSSEPTIIARYTGKAGADEADPEALYAGLSMAIDTVTGLDASGNNRHFVPSGIVPSTMTDGWPSALFTGASFLESGDSAAWLDGAAAASMVVDMEVDAAMADTTSRIFAQGDYANPGTNDSLQLGRLAVTSGGVPNVWFSTIYTASLLSSYTLGAANTATSGLALLVGSWEAGFAPDIYLDGAEIGTSLVVDRAGNVEVRTAGWYIGQSFIGELGRRVLLHPTAITPLQADIEARTRRRPLSLWGVGAWRQVADPEPCVAMPVRANATGGETIAVDVLASAIGADLTLESVAAGPRGAVEIVGGQASYTATGTAAGSDWFTFTIEDGNSFQSTGRCDVTIAAAGETPSLEGYLDIPAALSTLTTSDANLAADTQAAPAGRHLFLPAGTYAGRTVAAPNGTEANPVVWRPLDPDNPPVLTGEWNFTGGIWLTGMDFDGRSIVAGRKALRFNTPTVNGSTVAYSRIRNGGLGVELNVESSTRRFRVHRCLFDGAEQAQGTGLNGYEPIKIGVNASLIHDLEALIDYCRLKNYTAEAEALKIAGSNVTVYRCHWTNSHRVGVRQGNDCKFIETRSDAGSSSLIGRMTFFGADHLIRNCASHDLLIWRGNRDPDALTTGGSFWAACRRATVQNHVLLSGGAFEINGYPFSTTAGFTFDATGTLVSGSPTPTLLNGIGSPGTAATVSTVAAVTLADSDVGLDAYRTWLAAQ